MKKSAKTRPSDTHALTVGQGDFLEILRPFFQDPQMADQTFPYFVKALQRYGPFQTAPSFLGYPPMDLETRYLITQRLRDLQNNRLLPPDIHQLLRPLNVAPDLGSSRYRTDLDQAPHRPYGFAGFGVPNPNMAGRLITSSELADILKEHFHNPADATAYCEFFAAVLTRDHLFEVTPSFIRGPLANETLVGVIRKRLVELRGEGRVPSSIESLMKPIPESETIARVELQQDPIHYRFMILGGGIPTNAPPGTSELTLTRDPELRQIVLKITADEVVGRNLTRVMSEEQLRSLWVQLNEALGAAEAPVEEKWPYDPPVSHLMDGGPSPAKPPSFFDRLMYGFARLVRRRVK